MKPFQYYAPESILDAVNLLKHRRSYLMGGGTDLLVQWRRERIRVDHLINIKKIPELKVLSFNRRKGLTIGAAATFSELCENPFVRGNFPCLSEAASMIGGKAIQGRATLGGNICNAAPSGDAIPAAIVLSSQCRVLGPKGERLVPMEEFFLGPGETTLEAQELLVSVEIPVPRKRSGASYVRFTPRREMDIAVAGAASMIVLDQTGESIIDARIAVGAVAPIPLLIKDAGDRLVGSQPTEESFETAAKITQATIAPISDVRGTESQRRHLTEVLVVRALKKALERAMR